MNTEERLDLVTEGLRQVAKQEWEKYGSLLEEAADFLEELYAELFVQCQDNLSYRREATHEEAELQAQLAIERASHSPSSVAQPAHVTMVDAAKVLTMLRGLLEQADEVEADVGKAPTAQEALVWAIGEVKALVDPNKPS